MDPQIKRRRTLEAIKRILLRESLNQPLIVIFEDLHWIDGETQALLNLLADSDRQCAHPAAGQLPPRVPPSNGATRPTTRSSGSTRWAARAPTRCWRRCWATASNSQPLKRLIIERTEGNPFFMEEMVQALFDEGALVRNGAVKLTQPLAEIDVCRRRCRGSWPRASTGCRAERRTCCRRSR